VITDSDIEIQRLINFIFSEAFSSRHSPAWRDFVTDVDARIEQGARESTLHLLEHFAKVSIPFLCPHPASAGPHVGYLAYCFLDNGRGIASYSRGHCRAPSVRGGCKPAS
jgi:hypothetical protein